MNPEERDALGQLISNRIQHILEEKEDLENLLTVLGKPVMEAETTQKPSLDEINSLKSTEQTGSRGPYQLITKEENRDNSVFDKLQSHLKQHNGFVTLHNRKFWIFNQNPDKIGYRKK